MKQKTGLQMSSSLPVMILLNLSGGTQDACSYFLRDHVFANAQTGNIVLMGCYLISEDLRNSIRYFLPVAFFALIAGMPVMASIAMMVTSSDSEYAMGGIFITTICSLVTLPLVCLILQ